MKERTGRSGRFQLVDGRSHLWQKMTTQKNFQVSQKQSWFSGKNGRILKGNELFVKISSHFSLNHDEGEEG